MRASDCGRVATSATEQGEGDADRRNGGAVSMRVRIHRKILPFALESSHQAQRRVWGPMKVRGRVRVQPL
jgi:hypothetical protein